MLAAQQLVTKLEAQRLDKQEENHNNHQAENEANGKQRTDSKNKLEKVELNDIQLNEQKQQNNNTQQQKQQKHTDEKDSSDEHCPLIKESGEKTDQGTSKMVPMEISAGSSSSTCSQSSSTAATATGTGASTSTGTTGDQAATKQEQQPANHDTDSQNKKLIEPDREDPCCCRIL